MNSSNVLIAMLAFFVIFGNGCEMPPYMPGMDTVHQFGNGRYEIDKSASLILFDSGPIGNIGTDVLVQKVMGFREIGDYGYVIGDGKYMKFNCKTWETIYFSTIDSVPEKDKEIFRVILRTPWDWATESLVNSIHFEDPNWRKPSKKE